jgi:CheY-like chemotaxis protein
VEWVAAGRRFDAAAVKATLPHVSGAAVCDQLRQAGGEPLPCVLMAPLGWRARPPAGGGALTISKPLKACALRDALCKLLGEAPPQRGTSAAEAVPAAAGAQRVPLRVLLVEDNAVNQRVAVLVLQGLGYAPEVVGNGAEALDVIEHGRERKRPFDVVIMDLQMPVLDGLETTRRLCSQYPDPVDRPWVLALTANAMPGDRERCLAAGMDDYLSKPIRAATLAQALNAAAAGRQERLRSVAPAASGDPLDALDEDTRSALAELFVTEARRLRDAIHGAFAQRDTAALAAAAHALAGAAGYFDTGELSGVCARLEAAARAGEMGRVEEELPALDRAVEPALALVVSASAQRR